MANALTVSEKSRLKELEAIIAAGLIRFLEVGTALAEIRDKQLYRETHSRFADYVRERFGMADRQARRVIRATEVYENLIPDKSGTGPRGPVTDKATLPLPETEFQCRPLGDLEDAEEQREAWEAAVSSANGQQPTHAQVEEAVDAVMDAVPAQLKDIFACKALFQKAARAAQLAATHIRQAEESLAFKAVRKVDKDGTNTVHSSFVHRASSAIAGLAPSIPCAACHACTNPSEDAEACAKCAGKGFLTEEENEDQ